MRAVIALSLAMTVQGCATDRQRCEAEVRPLDTFGRLSWLAEVPEPPSWAVAPDCFLSDCQYSDPEGVHYTDHQGWIIDKELKVASRTKLPWGLHRTDGPEEVVEKLRRLTGMQSEILDDDGQPMVHLLLDQCQSWVEVHFDKDNRVEALSLNAQP